MAIEVGVTTQRLTGYSTNSSSTSHTSRAAVTSGPEPRTEPAVEPEPVPAVDAAAPRAEVDRELLEKSVSSVQEHINTVHRNINFEVDDTSGQTLVKVVDPVSGDLIRQLPPESIVATAQILAEMASKGAEPGSSGLLLEAEA